MAISHLAAEYGCPTGNLSLLLVTPERYLQIIAIWISKKRVVEIKLVLETGTRHVDIAT